MADSLNKDMDFCKCNQYDPKGDDDEQCKCGHDFEDHIQQVIGGCGSREIKID